ncbi:MAG: hypothetical protein UR23_C0002G0003 [Candidatus Roizmanbacteria bacterium GW2011_GWA2_32_13]|uniref:Membrane protein 6-pyruvoyl-tetrahydropterin synthase-related domain-containing protein n=1 Tax=Candidatus Roizmanbacteria bacterium GW2011_GWA2_32_13 TaxID=1618475 RepID=A0A0F9Z1N6_9BACT|nr:MAG: hypothetical protein UR23_C0002G0003 [Candidatus Roizmanbacteria bacterium GW2011_GWA2_32_13]
MVNCYIVQWFHLPAGRQVVKKQQLNNEAMKQLNLAMEKLFSIKKYIPHIVLLVIILFNFYLYRIEFKVLSDPNDNTFHYALIDDAKNVWKEVWSGKLSPIYLLDSWNERWAEGFSLSFYYSHLPEAAISFLSFFVPISTFKLFVIVRTLLLILLPVSFFLGARILGFSSGFGLIFAFLSQAIFTDGLYGLDSPSFLWRGWGLFSQLLAVFFLPLAFAYGIDYLKNKKNLGKALIFNFLLAQAHFGMFYLLLFTYPIFWIFSLDQWREMGKKVLTFLFLLMISLAYFIFPFFLTSQYRNFSLWDPIWKFNSWGLNQIIIWLTNGDLFDFNRFPFLTIFVIGGMFWGLVSRNKLNRYLVAIFGLYFIMFIGSDILGPLVNFIPGLGEYHLHRVIMMVQFTGLLIASGWLFNIIQILWHYLSSPRRRESSRLGSSLLRGNDIGSLFLLILTVVLGLYSVYLIEKPVINYVKDNNAWIERSNIDYQKNFNDYQAIISNMKKLPVARVYAGRPGNWGRNFKIGDTQVYMALAQDGFPTIGFLPESWSPNSDTEQFFDEENPKHYDLYNVGYLVLPIDKTPPQFAKLIVKKGKFGLYKIDSEGWFTLGKSSLEVITKKTSLINIAHLWLYSPMFANKDYPTIALNNESLTFVNRIIKMKGLNNYEDNKNIWKENPLLVEQEKLTVSIINKTEGKNQKGYYANFQLKNQCNNCILILKQTFHPNWKIYINGEKKIAFPIFPFYIGVPLNKPGNYKIEAIYQPSILKNFLLFFSVFFFIFIFKKFINKV